MNNNTNNQTKLKTQKISIKRQIKKTSNEQQQTNNNQQIYINKKKHMHNKQQRTKPN